MRSEDFPHPASDNRRGMFWSPASVYPAGETLDFWLAELEAMQVRWVKLVDDGTGSSIDICRRVLGAGMVPIVRVARAHEAFPQPFTPAENAALRRLIDAGVRYIETESEPDLVLAHRVSSSSDWLNVVVERFLVDAEAVLSIGGLPGLPALSHANAANPAQKLLDRGRADLFGAGVWIAVHSYTTNRPLDYPFDPVNRQGQPVSAEEYDQLGPWAWQGRPRDVVNEWRANDRQADPDLNAAGPCFLAWQTVDERVHAALGAPVPIIATEGGPVVGWQDDRRYPRVTPEMHAGMVTRIDGYLRGVEALAGKPCPDNFLALCYTLLANDRMGTPVAGWEPAAWYTGSWQSELGLAGPLPAVAVLKSSPRLATVHEAPALPAAAASLVAAATTPAAQRPGPEDAAPKPAMIAAVAAGTAAVTAAAAALSAPGAPSGPPPELAAAPAGAATLAAAAGGNQVVGQDGATLPAPAGPATLGAAAVSPSAASLPGNVVAAAAPSGDQGQSILGGKVIDNAAVPVQGAMVTLRWGEAAAQVATGRDGTFRFAGLPAGSYDVSVRNVTVAGVTVDGTAKRGIKLTLGPANQGPGQVSGRISGARAGRAVILSGLGALRQAVVDSGGGFSFDDVPPGQYSLALEGLGTVHERVQVEPGGLFRLVLAMAGRIVGQVIDAQPPAKAVLYSPPGWGWTRQCPVDFGGAFTFDGLPPGHYWLRVADHVVPELVITGNNTLIIPPIDLNPGHSLLSGCVTDLGGQPCAGAPVVLQRDGVFVARTHTGAQGIYEFRHLPQGNYSVMPESGAVGPAGLRLDGQELAARDLRVATSSHGGRSAAMAVSAAVAAFGATTQVPAMPAERTEKLVTHYLLFGSAIPGAAPTEAEQATTRLTLGLASEYLRRTGATGGFSLDEARQAARVTILGDLVSGEAEAALCAAGCQVVRIPGDPDALAQSLAQLTASLGEG